ncbi:hypothetical protein BC939DRAFT_322548 [Gamsiella multidivaricata]|uniref:uncharacterized protein n=1 Tax=Gamsiella multidivaricata TaxID=101098 RepID=UPI002220F580|nr:uncharacterized protein BC939DRAFT_322548 [Gamsiella multidivaricata]KAI7829823.1 hypothetical protein BC939DRAFT_322548 [Gamsiella multidivaricata]
MLTRHPCFYNIERALNKSLRTSVRGTGRPIPHPPSALSRSIFRPTKSISANKLTPVSKFVATDPEQADGAAKQEQQTGDDRENGDTTVHEFNTQRIIQHFDALSKKSKPMQHPLGVRRYGATAHRVEKKPPPTHSWRLHTETSSRVRDTASEELMVDTNITVQDTRAGSLTNSDEWKDFEDKRSSSTLPWISGSFAIKSSEFLGTKSVRQDRPPALAPGKRQEELYLSQVRLMQWYEMSRRAAQHFQEQEKSAEGQFEVVGRLILDKQKTLQSLKQRFEVEKELVELEATLGYQRDQLMAVISGLGSFKDSYESFSATLDHESNVLSIPGIDNHNLELWQGQIRQCQTALETWSRDESKNGELIQGIALAMGRLCDIVDQEIQELMQCMTLLARVREAESLESSLLSSSINP